MLFTLFVVVVVLVCIFLGFMLYLEFKEDKVTINTEECEDGVARGVVVDVETGSYKDELGAYKVQKKIQVAVDKGKAIIHTAKLEAAKSIYESQVNQVDEKSNN